MSYTTCYFVNTFACYTNTAVRTRHDIILADVEQETGWSFIHGLDAEIDFIFDESIIRTALYFGMCTDDIMSMLLHS